MMGMWNKYPSLLQEENRAIMEDNGISIPLPIIQTTVDHNMLQQLGNDGKLFLCNNQEEEELELDSITSFNSLEGMEKFTSFGAQEIPLESE